MPEKKIKNIDPCKQINFFIKFFLLGSYYFYPYFAKNNQQNSGVTDQANEKKISKM